MMRTHTFSGTTSREVLQKVKQALGDDALILSNRALHGGIEVVALSASDARPAETQPRYAQDTSAAAAPVATSGTQAAPLAPLAAPAPWMQPATSAEAPAPVPPAPSAVASGSIDG